MNKLKVLHLIESLGSGGAERLLHTNLRHFDEDLIESEVVTVYRDGDFWKQPVVELGVPVVSLECLGVKGMPGAILRLRNHLRTSKPDLIHTHLWGANIIGRVAGRLERIPVISSIHNPEYEPEVVTNAGFIVRRKITFARMLDRFTSRVCRRMIAVSKLVGESASRRLRYPIDKIDILYNPIDLSEIGNSQGRAEIIEELSLPESSRLLLNVGRVSPQKGLIHAIRAMPHVLRKYPDAHLISIGSQNDHIHFAAIKKEIETLGIGGFVHLQGERRNVQDYLKACDVFVFPSEYEGLGIALAEAMAAGCACVASEIKPLDEFVVTSVNGLFANLRRPDELAEKIGELLENPELRNSLGTEAKKTALDLFEPHAAARKLSDIYRSAMVNYK